MGVVPIRLVVQSPNIRCGLKSAEQSTFHASHVQQMKMTIKPSRKDAVLLATYP